MTRLTDVCRYVRSKNAGPFWITIDLFFKDEASFAAYADCTALNCAGLAGAFGVDEAVAKRFAIPSLNVVKFSYPRVYPQGGALERDMHGGQQFVDILDLEVDANVADAS